MIERTYTIPLRKGFINKAKHRKTKKAVAVLKAFLRRHMKSEKIKIGKNLNKFLWQHGIKNPPHHVKVQALKDDDGTVKAELLGFRYEHFTKEQKEKQKEEKPEKKETKKDEPKKDEPKVAAAKTVTAGDAAGKSIETAAKGAIPDDSAEDKSTAGPAKKTAKPREKTLKKR